MAEQRYCPRCRKTMADTNFYTYKNKEKAELCKSCQTAHIDNFDPADIAPYQRIFFFELEHL